MPVPTTSTKSKAAAKKPGLKPRIARRRGRARNEVESDEEIEREARSDSDSDSDLSSASSDDTEPPSEDVTTNGDARILTPSTRTPEDHPTKANPSFFAPSASWSDMVAAENIDGPADLPVIDFSDFDGRSLPHGKAKAKKSKKAVKRAQPPAASASSLPSPPLSTQEVPDEEPQEEVKDTRKTTRGRGSFPSRGFGQSARQAYQQRLENDPSYVPTVGEFWGHDDRLMDKKLRSLSGWWRGRWQGRGRGFSPRGRGGALAARSREEESAAPPDTDVSPIDKTWTHDGFEEMKKHEDRRRIQQQPSRGNFRGRGSFVPMRGRGSFPSPSRPRPPLPAPGRVWFKSKPQLMWTKQHEGFLYFDPSLRARHGEAPAIRVKLPGSRVHVVKPPVRTRSPSLPISVKPTTTTSSVHGSEYADKGYIVRIPKPSSKETNTVDELPIEDVFTVRPHLVATNPLPLPEPSNVRARSASTTQSANGGAAVQQQLENLSTEPQKHDPLRQAQTAEAVLRNPSEQTGSQDQSSDRPVPPPLQTTFTPPHQTPAYGSPYTYPSSPGIAVNQLGVPYEMATGRPVYLHPPPVYNHANIVPPNGVSYVPGHMRHHSTVEFMSPTHGPGFIDPATGMPLFSFPRQSSAVQIRAPSESSGDKPAFKPTSGHQRNSTLSTNAPVFQPRENTNHVRFPSLSAPANSDASSYPQAEGTTESQQGEMVYQPYQYYYPEAYGYNPYVDMQQYGEMYGQDSQVPMGTVYYA